jgi:hypothetical protein
MQKLLITGAIIATVTVLGLASRYFLGADNPVEEVCEDVIQNETGAEIDLSPGDSGDTGKSAAS